MLDKNGSELAIGDQVTVTGEVIATDPHGQITVRFVTSDSGSQPMVQMAPANVTKLGDSDTLKAAQKGFNDRNG